MITRQQFQEEMEEKFLEFFNDNAPYRRFMDSDWEEEFKTIKRHKSLSAKQFSESGMIIYLFAWVTRQFTEQHLKDLKDFKELTGTDETERSEKKEKPKDRDEPKFKNKKKFVIEIARMVRKQRLAELNQEFARNYKKQRLHVGGNKVLFDVLGNILRDEQETIDVGVTDEFIEIIDPFNNEAVQQIIVDGVQSNPSTVKRLAGLIKEAETPILGVVVTFQSCLQLECDGRIVLGQEIETCRSDRYDSTNHNLLDTITANHDICETIEVWRIAICSSLT